MEGNGKFMMPVKYWSVVCCVCCIWKTLGPMLVHLDEPQACSWECVRWEEGV